MKEMDIFADENVKFGNLQNMNNLSSSITQSVKDMRVLYAEIVVLFQNVLNAYSMAGSKYNADYLELQKQYKSSNTCGNSFTAIFENENTEYQCLIEKIPEMMLIITNAIQIGIKSGITLANEISQLNKLQKKVDSVIPTAINNYSDFQKEVPFWKKFDINKIMNNLKPIAIATAVIVVAIAITPAIKSGSRVLERKRV